MFISLKEKETVRAAYRTPMHKKTMAALQSRFLAEQSAFQRAEPIPGILNAEAANGARRLLIAAHDRPQKSFDVACVLDFNCCLPIRGKSRATHAPAPRQVVTDVVVAKEKALFPPRTAICECVE